MTQRAWQLSGLALPLARGRSCLSFGNAAVGTLPPPSALSVLERITSSWTAHIQSLKMSWQFSHAFEMASLSLSEATSSSAKAGTSEGIA